MINLRYVHFGRNLGFNISMSKLSKSILWFRKAKGVIKIKVEGKKIMDDFIINQF